MVFSVTACQQVNVEHVTQEQELQLRQAVNLHSVFTVAQRHRFRTVLDHWDPHDQSI